MEEHRSRASGWKYAKITGHKNESKLEYLMNNDADTQNHFLKGVNKPGHKIISAKSGGIYEKEVNCVFNDEKTKSKTDMRVLLDDGSTFNVSIKKSVAGQVYLISPYRFIRGYEKQYESTIPDNVKTAITLFWGSTDEVYDIIDKYGTKKTYEKRKHRLVGDTLKKYDSTLYYCLIDWFRRDIANVADFCFSRGLAAEKEEWANVVWYVNELNENTVNEIFLTKDLVELIASADSKEIRYGTVNGGTTVQLPFGFVQWHSPKNTIPGDMQFHHLYKKIKNLYNKR